MAGRLLELTPSEFEVLAYLVKQAPRVVSAEELAKEVLNYPGERLLGIDLARQHIHHIRQAIEKVSSRTDVIITRRSVGYILNEAS